MMLLRRILAVVLAVVGGVLALALAVVAFVLFTAPGARVALHVANERHLPAHAQSISGTLAHRFTLVGVEAQFGSVDASADTLAVTWRPVALRGHRLEVASVMVAGAKVRVTPAAVPP
ncbi:MAG TPA: hypothetical protein VFH88_04595, partial [Candidatus Krumholzibacteria bacterium]|nr:hypothetical protein [Candidatus Krumholzibacteria bacterium]